MNSEKGGAVSTSLGVTISTEPLGDFPDTLMVLGELIPRRVSEGLLAYIAAAGERSRRVAGVCTGAILLADAGLLDGRAATTHWNHAAALQRRCPGVRVDAARIFSRDGLVWTSAGMTAAIDMTLALIEEDHDAALAREIARQMVVYHRRPGGQSQFSALLELEPRSDRVRRALVYAKENLRHALTVEELADAASLSPRQFSRVFREETGQSPAKAVERLRLEAAKAMLEEGRHAMDVIRATPALATATACGAPSCASSASRRKASVEPSAGRQTKPRRPRPDDRKRRVFGHLRRKATSLIFADGA